MKLHTSTRVALGLAIALAAAFLLHEPADAQPRIKYCKDFQTGQIYIVDADMPCPGYTAEIN